MISGSQVLLQKKVDYSIPKLVRGKVLTFKKKFYTDEYSRMKRLIIVFGFILFGVRAPAQEFPFQAWHDGKIVLMSGDTLTGLVKYNVEGNVVQFDNKRQVKAFSSQKILFFEIFDNIFETYRQFYALPYQVQPNYKTPILFEVLHEGTLTLLAREYVVEESIPVYSYYSRHAYSTRSRLAFDYYFLDREGNIEKYMLKKNDLYEVLKKKEEDVKQFVKRNNLKYDRREDLVRIVAYYNSLLEGKI